MERILTTIGLGILLFVLFYILYINGYMVLNVKRAVMFIGSIKRVDNRCGARMASCNGWMKRVVRFREVRKYYFKLEYGITKGDLQIEIQNRKRQVVLLLNEINREGSINVEKNERYYIVLKFKDTTGEYKLYWS